MEQDHIGNWGLVLVLAKCLDGDFFPKGAVGLLDSVTVRVTFLRTI